EIAKDRLRLVKHEAVVFEPGHSAERMMRQVLRRFAAPGRYQHEPAGRALLFERGQHRAAERATGDAMDSESAHDDLLSLNGLCCWRIDKAGECVDLGRPAAPKLFGHACGLGTKPLEVAVLECDQRPAARRYGKVQLDLRQEVRIVAPPAIGLPAQQQL